MLQNLIFDWSGTLSDDFILVYKAVMQVFKELGLDEISIDEFRREQVFPYLKFYHKYDPSITKEQVEVLFEAAIHEVGDPKLYPGVVETLSALKEKGCRMVVLSTVPQGKLDKEAKEYGVGNFFLELLGSVYDKTEVVHDLMRRHGFNPEETAFVADMEHDMAVARAAGVKAIAITWGYRTAQRLAEEKPYAIISRIEELLKHI